MAEYYIKSKASSEAEGPFTDEELKKMVKEKRVFDRTLHFYDDEVGWQPIKANAELNKFLFGRVNMTIFERTVSVLLFVGGGLFIILAALFFYSHQGR